MDIASAGLASGTLALLLTGALNFYECFRCRAPFFGAPKGACADPDAAPLRDYDRADLVCAKCASALSGAACAKHGSDAVSSSLQLPSR
jgi:hypothetical protein